MSADASMNDEICEVVITGPTQEWVATFTRQLDDDVTVDDEPSARRQGGAGIGQWLAPGEPHGLDAPGRGDADE